MTPDWQNKNVAEGNAAVEQQIGINYGETTFHRNEYSYHVAHTDPPERKHEVGVRHLEAGMPRFAEKLFGELIHTGHGTTERAYYLALTALSDRSASEIDQNVFNAYSDACKVAGHFPYDQWLAALDAIKQLMSAVQRQCERTLDEDTINRVLDSVKSLPEERQGEITRHLGRLVGGATQDRLDAIDAHRVVAERMQYDRVGRAWKFFQPDPAAPRLPTPSVNPAAHKAMIRVSVGAGLALLGVFLIFPFEINVVVTALGLVVFGVGTYAFTSYGAERAKPDIQARRKAAMFHHPAVQPVSPGHWVTTAFVKDVHLRVDTSFQQARRHVTGSWGSDTRGLREYYKDRFVNLYGNAQATPASINWLINWHAERIATRWRAGTLDELWIVAPASTQILTFYGIGFAVGALGLLCLALAGAYVAAAALAVGGFVAAQGMIEAMATKHDDKLAKAENQQLFQEEKQAYVDWQRLLSDRPADEEMGRWLDLDKAYLQRNALHRCGLTNDDLVTYVLMSQGAPKAERARVKRAPVRYSDYVVLVFLLTKSGVREVEVDLDFLTGKLRDERRTAFSYNALASARVAEIGERVANEDGYLPDSGQPLENIRLRSREFRLSLVNNEQIKVRVENFSGLTDYSVEEEAELLRMALQASGIAGAIHVLEAVAAEGRDWIARDQERRQRRSQDWTGYEVEPTP
jgi:hypothetical protein